MTTEMTIRLIASFAIAFLISLGFGAWLVPFLRKMFQASSSCSCILCS